MATLLEEDVPCTGPTISYTVIHIYLPVLVIPTHSAPRGLQYFKAFKVSAVSPM